MTSKKERIKKLEDQFNRTKIDIKYLSQEVENRRKIQEAILKHLKLVPVQVPAKDESFKLISEREFNKETRILN